MGIFSDLAHHTQQIFICSKSTIEKTEQCLKSVRSLH